MTIYIVVHTSTYGGGHGEGPCEGCAEVFGYYTTEAQAGFEMERMARLSYWNKGTYYVKELTKCSESLK